MQNGSGMWTNALNWSGGVPTTTDPVWFTNQNVNASLTVTVNTARTIALLTFSNNTTVTYNFATNAGGVLTLGSGGTDGVIKQNWAGAVNFNMGLTLALPLTVTGDGDGLVTINGVISGAQLITKSGASTLVLNGANTASAGLTMSAGVLEFGNNGAAGTGTLTLSGGVIRAGGASRSLTNAVTLGGDFAVAGVNDLTLSGATALAATRTLTITNTGLTTLSGAITGVGGLVKNGSEVLVLSGANSYSGATVVSNGTLRLGAAGGFSDSSAFTIVAGTTADLNNFNDTIGSLAGDGNVTLGSGYLTAGGNNTSTLFGGVLSGSGGGFTKAGTGALTVTNANTYTGATTNSAGTLVVTINNALGTAASGTSVSSGATLGFSNSVNYATAETLDIGGFGVGGLGAIRSFTGDNIFAGNITSTSASMIGSLAGSLTLNGSIDNGGFRLIVTNAANSVITLGGSVSGGGVLLHDGAGTTILAAANTYTGATTNRIGTLVVASDGALGTAAQGTRVLSGATLAFSNSISYATAEIIGIAGTGTGGLGVIENIQGNNTFAGVITNTAASMIGATAGSLTLSSGGSVNNSGFQLILTNAADTWITLDGVVSGAGSLFHDGDGTTILGANNTYTGATTNRLGTLVVASDGALGTVAQGTRVLSGATLAFSNSVNYATTETIGIDGTGTGGLGVIENIQGNNTFAGIITNTAASTIRTSAGTLTLSGNITNSGFALTLNNASGTTLTNSGKIQGAGGLIKDGTGATVLSGVNQYWGATTVSAGTLRIGAVDAISNASAVTVAGGAILDLNGFSDRVGSLDGAGNVTLGAGRLYAGTNGTTTTSSGAISGAGGLTKEGTGTMVLAGANTYDGMTTNSAGTLIVAANTALGSANAGTEVIAGATLGLSNNVTATEQIMIAGTGVGGLGAINNLDGNNILSGAITNTAAATIGASSGTLTLNGAIANAGFALTFTNAGGATIQVNGGISGSGALRNLGAGTTSFLTNNTFTGNTIIDAGTLSLQVASALGSVTNVTVNSAGTLQFSGATGVTDRINDAATMTFLGGTLDSQDYTDTFSTLTLGANSIFNLGLDGNNDDLTFSSAVWTAGTLTINNWVAIDQDNPILGGADDRFFLTVNPGAGFLTNIFFTGFGLGANWVSGQLTPSNAPAVWTGNGGNGLWSTANNWNPSGTPASGRALIFVGDMGGLVNNVDGASAAKYSGITFATNAAGAFLIGGNVITNGGGGIVNKSQYLQSFTNRAVVLSAKQIWNAASNGLSISSGVTNSGFQLTLTGDNAIALDGVINGAGGLYKSGAGTATLTGNNLFTGAITNEAGTLIVTVNNALGTTAGGTVILSGGTLGFSNSVNYSTAEALTISGAGVGGLGALSSLGGSNTFAGAVTLADDSTIGASAGYLVLSSTVNNGGFLLSVNNAAGSTNVLSGVISGVGGLTKLGDGTLTLNAKNNYGGATTISSGTLRVGNNNNVLTNTTAVTVSGTGTFDLNNFTNTIGSLAGDGTVALGTGKLTTGRNNSDTLFSGTLTGSGGFTKEGTGAMTLAGASAAYTGAITNSDGLLIVSADAALGDATGHTVVNSGATLGFSNVTYSTAERIRIAGTGVGGLGAINNLFGNNTFAGVISNTAAATIGSSAGTLTLSGVISNNTQQLTFDNAAGSAILVTGLINSSGPLAHSGTGTTVLANNNTLYTGAITNNEGLLIVSSDGALGTVAAGTIVADGATLGFSNSITYSTVERVGIAGSGVGGLGAINNLSGVNSFAGTITNNAASTIGTMAGTLTLSGVITNSGYLLTVTNASSTTLTISGQIQGAGGLNKDGAGDTVLSAANQYWGATTISGGTLRLGGANAISNASAVTVNSGATFDLNNFSDTLRSLTGAGTLQFGSGGANTLTVTNSSDITFSGAINGTSDATDQLVKLGSGKLTLSGSSAYTGKTTINGGTISVGADNNLGAAPGSPAADQLTLNGGTLATTATFTLATNRGMTLGASGGTVDTATSTVLTYGGIIAGSGNFTKTGSGKLILNGSSANTFSGTTTINGGTLDLNTDGALGSTSDILLGSGGTLLFTGASTARVNNAATVTFSSNGGTIDANDATETMGALTLSAYGTLNLVDNGTAGSLTFDTGSWTAGVLVINGWSGSGGTGDRIFLTGLVQDAFLANVSFNGYGYGALMVGTELVPIPEPGTVLSGMLLASFLLRKWSGRRKT